MGEQKEFIPEQKHVTGYELSSEDGLATYSLHYSDGTDDPWQQTRVDMADKPGVEQLRRELDEKYGLSKHKEE